MVDLLEEDSWKLVLNHFKNIAKKYDSICFKRKRILDSYLLVLMIINLVHTKGKQGYATIINDFWIRAKKVLLRLPSQKPIAQSSFSEARSKLDPCIFKELNQALIRNSDKASYHWQGHRVLSVDGSKINLPRELLNEGFRLPNPQSYYPQGLVSCLYDLYAKVPFDFMLSKSTDERACADQHLNCLSVGDIVVYDRGYASYGLLYRHIESGVHTVMRMETTTTFNAVKTFANSRYTDKIVRFSPAEGSIGKIRHAHLSIEIKTLTLRLIKYKIKDKLYVLATTLLDQSKYTKEQFRDLYQSRWNIEEMYKILKSHAGMNDFHGKTTVKVEQEFYASMLLITLVRLFSNSTQIESSPLKKTSIQF